MSFNSDEIAVEVKNVTKIYKIFDTPGKRFRYHMFHTKEGDDFVALKDVSFSIKKGESFGIIGRNGSGKSTMLQILAGIIKQTSGEVNVNGKVAALLELGSGFNPESTGIENIYMNAAILGVKKADIDAKVKDIVEFADIGDFINQPVKTYSSGMFVRLAFSVAINVDAEVILIDEALAVGDVFFRQKCYSKLDDLKKQGKTIILVSHGMNEVEQFCDRVLLLNKSEVVMCGNSREAVQRYYVIDSDKQPNDGNNEELGIVYKKRSKADSFNGWKKKADASFNCVVDNEKEIGNKKARFLNIGIFDKDGNESRVFHQGEEAYFLYEVETFADVDVPIAGIVFYDQRNTIIYGKDNLQTYSVVPQKIAKGSIVSMLFKVKLDIAIGEYTFDAGFNSIDKETYETRMNLSQAMINEHLSRDCMLSKVGCFSVHECEIGNPTKVKFHGCCDLATEIEIK